VLPEAVNAEAAVMATPLSSMVTIEFITLMELPEDPVTARLGSCSG
jgi:hypothetical protein